MTPRRLSVIADGIPSTQPDRAEERRGPRVGAPEAAVAGFLRAAGLTSLDQCEKRATDRGEFYFAVIAPDWTRNGGDFAGVCCLSAIIDLPWPKSMRFPAAELRWVRPLTSVICLFDGEVGAIGAWDRSRSAARRAGTGFWHQVRFRGPIHCRIYQRNFPTGSCCARPRPAAETDRKARSLSAPPSKG